MGLGRNANAQDRWEDAIKQFDYVIKLARDYSFGYSFRAISYVEQEKWDEATNDIITAFSLDWDETALGLVGMVKEDVFIKLLLSKLKVQSVKRLNDAKWSYITGNIYEQSKKYDEAIKAYNIANSKEPSPTTYLRISVCHYREGSFDAALKSINQALNMDSTNLSYMEYRANIYYEMGEVKSAIVEWDKVLAAQPEYSFGYYRRGWFKMLDGDSAGAMEDLSMAIVLDPQNSYAYEARGDVYLKQGNKDLAEADFKKVIEIEKTPDDYKTVHYAYEGLGQYELVAAAMDSIIARDSTYAGIYYDAACLYSRMKDKGNALKYLEKSLALGYKRFSHIEHDTDMDFIRNEPEFKELIERYKEQRMSNEEKT